MCFNLNPNESFNQNPKLNLIDSSAEKSVTGKLFARSDEISTMIECIELLVTLNTFLMVLITLSFSFFFTFKVLQEYGGTVVFKIIRLKVCAAGLDLYYIKNHN